MSNGDPFHGPLCVTGKNYRSSVATDVLGFKFRVLPQMNGEMNEFLTLLTRFFKKRFSLVLLFIFSI